MPRCRYHSCILTSTSCTTCPTADMELGTSSTCSTVKPRDLRRSAARRPTASRVCSPRERESLPSARSAWATMRSFKGPHMPWSEPKTRAPMRRPPCLGGAGSGTYCRATWSPASMVLSYSLMACAARSYWRRLTPARAFMVLTRECSSLVTAMFLRSSSRDFIWMHREWAAARPRLWPG